MDTNESPMRIVVADDHALVRGGVGILIKILYPDTQLVECNSYEKTISALTSNEDVDLLLLDLLMPGMESIASVRHICSTWPDLPVIVVSVREDAQTIREALRAGAMGYIPKTSAPEVAINAIRLVLSGGIYVPPDVLQLSGSDIGSADTEASAGGEQGRRSVRELHGLTNRQEDVMNLISEGRSNKEIASQLNLTTGTVKMHLSRIYKILGAKSRTDAIAKYSRRGSQIAKDAT